MRCIALVLFLLAATPALSATVTVFAAASLSGALDNALRPFERATGHTVRTVYAGSATLARQISVGAPADLFISAHPQWVDWLEGQGEVQARSDVASNTLVLISAAPDADLNDLLAEGRLAIGLVEAVPAGIYAKAALEHAGYWETLRPRLVETDNVRAALSLVARGDVPFGIVYETDAAGEDVTTLKRFDGEAHPPISYAAALLSGQAAARDLYRYLAGPNGRAALQAEGFGPPSLPSPNE